MRMTAQSTASLLQRTNYVKLRHRNYVSIKNGSKDIGLVFHTVLKSEKENLYKIQLRLF